MSSLKWYELEGDSTINDMSINLKKMMADDKVQSLIEHTYPMNDLIVSFTI